MICDPRSKSLVATALLSVSCVVHAGAACLLFPLSCLKPSKKFGEEQEALVLDVNVRKTEHYEQTCVVGGVCGSVHKGFTSLNDSLDFYYWFKVGDTLYEGWHQNTGAIASTFGYKPKRADWVGKTLKMKFYDEKFLGVAGVGAIFKRPGDGDDYRMTIVQIYGPDGVPECKYTAQVCPPQAKVNRAEIEAKQLAKLAKTGAKSATDVLPARVEAPNAVSAGNAAAPQTPPSAAAEPPAPAPAAAESPSATSVAPVAAPEASD